MKVRFIKLTSADPTWGANGDEGFDPVYLYSPHISSIRQQSDRTIINSLGHYADVQETAEEIIALLGVEIDG